MGKYHLFILLKLEYFPLENKLGNTNEYDQKFSGMCKIKFRILSTGRLSFGGKGFLKTSHTDDINMEQLIYTLDLNDKDKIKGILDRYLKEFLRYFGYDLKEVEKKLNFFEDMIKLYFEVVFK